MAEIGVVIAVLGLSFGACGSFLLWCCWLRNREQKDPTSRNPVRALRREIIRNKYKI